MKPQYLHDWIRRLPVVLQAESAECGLACIAMVAGYHGHRVDLTELRGFHATSSHGASVEQLMRTGSSLGLLPRALRLEPEEIPALKLPAVLHWDLDHFVVLRKVTARHVWIHDPAVGQRRYSKREIGRHFTGVAIEFLPGREFRVEDRRQLPRIRDLFAINSGVWSSLGQVFLLSVLLQIAALLTPFYIQLSIDQGLARRDTDLILVVALAFLMIVLARTILGWLRGIVLIHLSHHVGFQMVNNVFHHLLRLPVAWFERRHMGDIVSRFSSLDTLREMVSRELVTVLVDGLFSLATLVLLYIYSPLLASLTLVWLLVFTILRMATLPGERHRRQELIAAEAAQQSMFMENVRSIMVSKLYSMEQHRLGLWQSRYAELINRGARLGRFQLHVSTFQTLIFGLDHVLTIYFGTRMVYAGDLSIGQLMAFIFLKQHFVSSVSEMIPRLVEVRLLRLQRERLADITGEQPEFDRLESSVPVLPLQGRLQARALTYRYPGSAEPILRDVNVEVNRGECLAIQGPSGCGKSTLLKLLTGLLTPDAGELRIDGRVVRGAEMRAYRQQLAAVLHGDAMLSGSLLDNMVLDRWPPDDARLKHYCRLCGLEAELQQMPNGWHTPVGDIGQRLSAGQTQRVLLVRALYREPAILFLDEAMANLADGQAQQILGELRRLGITLVMVTHNPALLACADRHLSLDQAHEKAADQKSLCPV